jgi:hypothetical protein
MKQINIFIYRLQTDVSKGCYGQGRLTIIAENREKSDDLAIVHAKYCSFKDANWGFDRMIFVNDEAALDAIMEIVRGKNIPLEGNRVLNSDYFFD